MLYATNRFPGDGTTTQYEISFVGGYLDRAHVKAYVEGADFTQTPVTINPANFLGPNTIKGFPVVPVGSSLVIYRDTPKNPIVDFVNGSRLTETNLDTATRQGAFIAAEGADVGQVTSAMAQAAIAAQQAAIAAQQAVIAIGAAQAAQASAGAIGAAVLSYGTYAAAQAAAPTLLADSTVEVSQDETRAGARTRYKVQAGALVFVVNLDQTMLDLGNSTDPTKGASLVGYLPAGVGAVGRALQGKLRDTISVFDFLTPAQIADVQAGTLGQDVTLAVQAAITAAYGKTLHVPPGSYKLATPTAGALLTITNRIRIVADFGASFVYGSSVAGTVDVIKVSPSTVADEGVEIDGLWIHEQGGSPARDVLRIVLDATHGLKKLRINRCLFRAKNGRAINCTNAGELNSNGLFLTQLTVSEFYGGVTLDGLGDSTEIASNVIAGHGVGILATMLSPSAATGTSAKLSIRANNITAQGGGIVINRGRGVTIEDNNIEQTVALPGGYCIAAALMDYDASGVSVIRNNKIEPADGTAQCGGVSLYQCNGTLIHGNQIGTSSKPSSSTIAVAVGDCDFVKISDNELFLSADCTGVLVNAASSGCSYQRGKLSTYNGSYTEISDSGEGTAGAWKTPSLQNSWANNVAGYQTARFQKTADGFVFMDGVLASGTLTPDTVMFTLPAGFRPAGRQAFIAHASTAGGVFGRVVVRVDTDGSVRMRNSTEGAAVLLEVSLCGMTFKAA